MKGFTALFTHKKHSMTIVGLLLLMLMQADVDWLDALPKLGDHIVNCITTLVAVAVICQTVHDVAEIIAGIWKPDLSELVKGLNKGKGQQQ